MKWTTRFDNVQWLNKLDYQSDFFFMGSCFSNHMSSFLDRHKFTTWINPFGNVYNPTSIGKQISLLSKQNVDENDLCQHRHGHWFHWDLHSDMYGYTPIELIELIGDKQSKFMEWCRNPKPKVVLITLGTAWVYTRKDTDIVVGNCHGMPNTEFSKEILSLNDIVEELKSMMDRFIEVVEADIRFVFTISPVRYLRDGFVENQRSKARLILAVEELVSEGKVDYFPAYELFMDDLRDYRYVDADLVHPNDLAVKYIQEKFRDHCFSDYTIEMMKALQPILAGLNHRFKSKNKALIQSFATKQLQKLSSFQSMYSEIDLSEEVSYYRELMKPNRH